MTKINLEKVIIWDEAAEALAQFHELVELAPLRSVVVEIHPEVAAALYKVTNTNNRKLGETNLRKIKAALTTEKFLLTGDTLKFDETGNLLDGQHRLKACEASGCPLITHVVFGLSDATRPMFDEGKKRSPADVLTLHGYKDATTIAGAIRWVLTLETGESARYLDMTNAETLALAQGRMAGVAEHTKIASVIWKAFKYPPSLIAAFSYVVAQHNKRLSHEFFHEWLHGARIGRNQTFDKLSARIIAMTRESGGHINPMMRAACLVQAFNYWRANEVVSLRALTWRKDWQFPKLVFSGLPLQGSNTVSAETVDKVMALIKAGMDHKAVAEKLHIARVTVDRAVREHNMSATHRVE